MGYGMTYTDEMRQFILDNYKGIYAKELAERFNERFGTNVTADAMKSYKTRYGLKSGLTGCFPKGHVPANKGKKMSPEVYEKCKKTMFKTGQAPVNYRPVGSERINVDGYIEVKVKDPRTWKLKHRIVWEEANGPVSKGSAIIMLDGDKTNCELSNLKLVKRSELLIINRHHLFQDDAQLNDTAANLAKMINAVNGKKKKRKKVNRNNDIICD